MINKISATEMDMIQFYRTSYVFNEYDYVSNYNFILSTELLATWNANKSEYLSKLFGGELILSKKIQFNKSYDMLADEMFQMVCHRASFGREGKTGAEFIRSFDFFIDKNYSAFSWEQVVGLRNLYEADTLAKNIYNGDTFEFVIGEHKTIKVQKGSKAIKMLGKIAKEYDLYGWEDFRICHSQILNQKKLSGTLSISIHPLDYMTMSDNTYGWDSCMTWEDDGCYRQGTVEMMNSKNVVIAYLSGDDTMSIGVNEWNSKKWRSLFVVDEKVMASVKGYPYRNDELSKEVMSWLKELAEKNLNWNYNDINLINYNDDKISLSHLPEEKNNFQICFLAKGNMYNDFGGDHFMCFSNAITPEDIKRRESDFYNTTVLWFELNYCGPSQCMVCGSINPDLEEESSLACNNCKSVSRCDLCGDKDPELFEIDGLSICSNCYEYRVHECVECGDEHLKDDMLELHIIPRMNEQDMEEKFNTAKENTAYSYLCAYTSMTENGHNEAIYLDKSNSIWLCPNCMDEWLKQNLKPGEMPHFRRIGWDPVSCIYFDQINESCFDNYIKNRRCEEFSNEAYLKSFSDRRLILSCVMDEF